MWGLSNIREYKSLSSFFTQKTFFQITSKQFFIQQIFQIFFKPSTMFYENKTGASRILESISPFPLSFIQFFFVQKTSFKTNFQTVFQTSRLLIKQSTMFYRIKHGPPH